MTDKPCTVLITREVAVEFARMDSVPSDRPLSERRLNAYRLALSQGMFRPVAWAKCYCEETGTTYRVNGKHTSTMLSGLDPIPTFYATIESYKATTLEDVVRLYSTFDSRAQVRTASDIYRSFAASVPELRDLPQTVISVAAPAMTYAAVQDGYANVSAADRAEKLFDEVDFVLWLDGILRGGNQERARHIWRLPVVAAMFLTFNKSKRQATVFWSAVRDETGTSPSCPDRVLAKFLLTINVNNGMGAQAMPNRRAMPREFFFKSLRAWNAFRKGEELEKLQYSPSSRMPVPV